MQTTTFRQVVGTEAFWMTVPVGRVELLLEKIDEALEIGKISRAKKLMKRYLSDAPKPAEAVVVKLSRKDEINALLLKCSGLGQRDKIALLQQKFEMSYNNARYYAVRS